MRADVLTLAFLVFALGTWVMAMLASWTRFEKRRGSPGNWRILLGPGAYYSWLEGRPAPMTWRWPAVYVGGIGAYIAAMRWYVEATHSQVHGWPSWVLTTAVVVGLRVAAGWVDGRAVRRVRQGGGMSERPAHFPDWPEQWEVVTGYPRGCFWPCVSCGTEVAPARRCYEVDGDWRAEYASVCPNGCAAEDRRADQADELRLP